MRKLILFIAVVLMASQSYARDTTYYAKLSQDNLKVGVFFNKSIKSNIDYLLANKFTSNQSVIRTLSLAKKLLPVIEEEFVKNDLPKELAVMCISNTFFSNGYVGRDGAVGIWPLSFSMAKRYNLRINSYIDERRSNELSTKAAIQFIKELYVIYKDWHLVVTAFRSGAINVNLAIRRANDNLYFPLVYEKLEEEDRKIIDSYMAWLYLYNHGEKHGLKYDAIALTKTDTVSVNRDISLNIFTSFSKMTEKDFRSLNPVFKGDLIPGSKFEVSVIVPDTLKDSIAFLIPAMADSTKNLTVERKAPEVFQKSSSSGGTTASGKKLLYYRIKSGDNLGLIADCYDVLISDLKRWNKIRGTTIIAGKKLKVYVKASKYSKYKYIDGYSASKKRALARKD